MGKATNAAKKAAAEVRKNIVAIREAERIEREENERIREEIAWERKHYDAVHNGVRREYEVFSKKHAEEFGVVGIVRVITTNFNHEVWFGSSIVWREGSLLQPAGSIELTKEYFIKGSFNGPDEWELSLYHVIVKDTATRDTLCDVKFGSLTRKIFYAHDLLSNKFDTVYDDGYSGTHVTMTRMVESHSRMFVGEPWGFDIETGRTTCHDIRRREVLNELRDLWVMDEFRYTNGKYLEI